MSVTKNPSVLWNVQQDLTANNNAGQKQACKNIGLFDRGTVNVPIYFSSAGEAVKMNNTKQSPYSNSVEMPMVITTGSNNWAGWATASTSSYYGVDLEIGGGQVNRGVYSMIPDDYTSPTKCINDNWIVAKGADRNCIVLNRTPGNSLSDYAGGYAFSSFNMNASGAPTWNNIRTTGLYAMVNSPSVGTNGSPELGRIGMLAIDSFYLQSNGIPSSQATDHYTTQLAMGSGIHYRVKTGNGDWDPWVHVITQYKDTIPSTVSNVKGFKLLTTQTTSVNEKIHYTALVSITPIASTNTVGLNEPYIAYMEIYHAMGSAVETNKETCNAYLKMLSTPKLSDDGGARGPFVIRADNYRNEDSETSADYYKHNWYISRFDRDTNINDFSITITPLSYDGNIKFKGIERCTSIPYTQYIAFSQTTPTISGQTSFSSSTNWCSMVNPAEGSGIPVYVDNNGGIRHCDDTALRKHVNGSNIGDTKTPVYIDSNGQPSTCTITIGPVNTQTTITNHMYTAVRIADNASGNLGGEMVSTSPLMFYSFAFPTTHIPTYSPRQWPAGIMLFVNLSLWINDSAIEIPVYDSSASYYRDAIVSYANTAYKCYKSTSGTFNPNCWESMSISTHMSASAPQGYAVTDPAAKVYIGVFQDSTQLQCHRFAVTPTFDDYVNASFSAITVDPITSSTRFYIKVWTEADTTSLWAYTYNISALI